MTVVTRLLGQGSLVVVCTEMWKMRQRVRIRFYGFGEQVLRTMGDQSIFGFMVSESWLQGLQESRSEFGFMVSESRP